MNIIISGASSGVGFEAVLELIGSGNHKVIALARSEDKLYKLQEIQQEHMQVTVCIFILAN